MEGEDYAVKAAKEWLSGEIESAKAEAQRDHVLGPPCDYCEGKVQEAEAKVGRLAAVIRKHVKEWSNQPCHHNGAHYPFCGHPDY